MPDLSYSYVYRFTPLMEQRLSQAGVRLAAYLNAIYAEPQPLGRSPAMIRKFVAALAALCVSACTTRSAAAAPVAPPVEVQILAFNDFHGNLETPPPVEVTQADGTNG